MRTEPGTKRTGSEVDPLTKQLDSLYSNELYGDDCLRTGPSIEERLAIKMATETITPKNGHYKIGLPWRDASTRLLDSRMIAGKRLNGLEKIFTGPGILCQIFERKKGIS